MAHEVYVVVESSRAGETVVGAFSTLEKARAVLPRGDSRRLEDYRVEFHVIDEPVEEEQAWTVVISRDGSEIEVSPVILCSCGDDHDRLENSSYIEAGGGRMHPHHAHAGRRALRLPRPSVLPPLTIVCTTIPMKERRYPGIKSHARDRNVVDTPATGRPSQ